MNVPIFRVGAARPRLVPHLICLTAMSVAIAAWQFSLPMGLVAVSVVFVPWLLVVGDRPEEGNGLLPHLPRRTAPDPLPVPSKEYTTLWVKLLAGETVTPPSHVEGTAAAWSIDIYETDVGLTHRVSSTAPLVLENADGVHFCIEPEWSWSAVTSRRSGYLDPLSEERIAEVRRDLARYLPSASRSPENLDADLEHHLRKFAWSSVCRQSVFFVGQWVAITGSFAAHPNPVFRGQPLPTFRMRSGQIDDCSLDERWERYIRFSNYGIPVIALLLAGLSLLIAIL